MSTHGTLIVRDCADSYRIVLHAWHTGHLADAARTILNIPLVIARAPRRGYQSFGIAHTLRTLLQYYPDQRKVLEECQLSGPTELGVGRIAAFIVAAQPTIWEPTSTTGAELADEPEPGLEVVISRDGDRDGTIELRLFDSDIAAALAAEVVQLSELLGPHFTASGEAITMSYARALIAAIAINP